MEPQLKFDLNEIQNLEETVSKQIKKFHNLRNLVKDLNFAEVEPVGIYSSVTYKSFDGGKMGIYFDPFELDFVVIADSFGNELMKFLVPKGHTLGPSDFAYLDDFTIIKKFLALLDLDTILQSSAILSASKIAMELAELASIFERLTRDKNEPIVIMKDGLLRTIALKEEHIDKLIAILKLYKKRKLVGVAKSSKVLNLISSALFIEKKIPLNKTGFIEIPWNIERIVYKWTGKGTERASELRSDFLHYAFGKLYVAKLSKMSNLLVTIEVPYDFKNNSEIYTKHEVHEIIGHLIKDSTASYPVLGYPQTIMRAHEKAVRTGFTASIWRQKIIDRILNEIGDKNLNRLMKESNYLREYVNKGILGGF